MSIGFSKTFGLKREILSRALSELEGNPRISRSELMSRLGVGSQKAEAMVLWLGKLGLRDNQEREITPLGTLLLRHDLYLEDMTTLWLLHYQLASNPDAEVWYVMTNRFLPSRTEFRFADAINFLVSQGLRTAADKHLRADVSIFLRAFMLEEGLGKAGFLTAPEGEVKTAQLLFHKRPPTELSPYLGAYAMYDQMARKFPSLSTITIEELATQEGNVGRVFSLNRNQLEELLRLTSSSRYDRLTDLSKTAGLNQVGLRFKGQPVEILERYFKNK